MSDFFKTRSGQRLVEHVIPQILYQLTRIANALEGDNLSVKTSISEPSYTYYSQEKIDELELKEKERKTNNET